MYKRFTTAEGKRMKVKMTDSEALSLMLYNTALFAAGLMIATLLWLAI